MIFFFKKRGLFGSNVLKNPDRYHPRRPRGGQLGLEKLRQKFSRTGERAPLDASLNKPVPRLIRTLASDRSQQEASIYRAAFVIFRIRSVYPQTRLFAVTVWLVQKSFLRGKFSVKMGPYKPKKFHTFRVSEDG